MTHILIVALPVTCGGPLVTDDLPYCQTGKNYDEHVRSYDWRGLVPPPDLAVPPDMRAMADLALPVDAGGTSDGGAMSDGGAPVDGGTASQRIVVQLPKARCEEICAVKYLSRCDGELTVGSAPVVRCFTLCQRPGCGRRPEGMAEAEVTAPETPGGYLTEAAYLEAASVTAFQRLAAELSMHSAPRRLVRAAQRAARDEVRHTRSMGRLAQRYRGMVKTPPPTGMGIRDLESIAPENTVEGCVFETYGAMIAAAQARLAHDKVVRAVLERIAIDEARHAALAFEVARWCHGRLDAKAQVRIEEAKQRAVKELTLSARREPPAEVVQQLGVPSAALAQVLLAGLHTELWQHIAV